MAVLKKVPPSHFGMCCVGQYTPPAFVAAAKHGGGSWNNIAPTRPTNAADPSDPAYGWGGLDSFLTYAKARGWAIEYILGYAPLWSNGGQSTQYPPTLLSDYTNWCTAYLTRYANKIAAVEPWNEVSDPTSVTGYAGTLSFLISMEQSLRNVINAVSPKTLLLTPSTYYGNGLTYHAQYFAAGGGAVCDGLAWHAYPLNVALKNNFEQFDNTTRFYRALLAQYGKAGCPIWVTEGGYSNSDGDPLAMGSLYPLFMACFAGVSLPYAWNRPAGGNTSLDYWLGAAYPQDANPRGQAYRTMQAMLMGATITQEPARTPLTNLVRNPDGAGSTAGVIGSGGVMPTNWLLTAPDSGNGVTVEVKGTTTYNGETGVAIRIYGTPTAGAAGSTSFGFEGGANQVLATLAQQLSVGAEIALIAGSMNNLGAQLAFNEYAAGGGYLASTMGSTNAPVVPIATAVFWEWAAKIVSPTCAYIVPKFGVSYTVGNAFDATFFIKSARSDAGVVWTAALSRDNGWTGLLAWTADGSNPSFSVPGTFPWQRGPTNDLGPVQNGVATLGRAPRLFESIAWGGMTLNYPNAKNTGVQPGVTLTTSGNILTDNDGQVIQNMDVTGYIYVNRNNVTIRNCRVTCTNNFAVIQLAAGVTGTTVEHCEVNGGGLANPNGPTGISIVGRGTFRYNNIYNVGDGFSVSATDNVLISDNYIHTMLAAGSPHYDGVQLQGNLSNVTLRHNTIYNDQPQTSALMITNDSGSIDNVLVEDNVLVGGGYTIYCDNHGTPNITDVTIRNNHVGAGSYGETAISTVNPVYTGNASDGAAVLAAVTA